MEPVNSPKSEDWGLGCSSTGIIHTSRNAFLHPSPSLSLPLHWGCIPLAIYCQLQGTLQIKHCFHGNVGGLLQHSINVREAQQLAELAPASLLVRRGSRWLISLGHRGWCSWGPSMVPPCSCPQLRLMHSAHGSLGTFRHASIKAQHTGGSSNLGCSSSHLQTTPIHLPLPLILVLASLLPSHLYALFPSKCSRSWLLLLSQACIS